MTGQNAPPNTEDHGNMPNEPELDPKVQEAIGKALKAYCDDIVAAPIPAKFLALLAKLEAKEREGS